MVNSTRMFDDAFAKTVGREGGFSNAKNDAGGATRFGITEAEARRHGYVGDMKFMPFALAKQIMRSDYWDALRLDQVGALSEKIAAELFDTGVNMGVGTAGKFLQRALNVFNRGGTDYPDITVDGAIGPRTLSAFEKYLAVRRNDGGESAMLDALDGQQLVRYFEIAEANPSQEDFTFGWVKQRVSLIS